MILNSWNLLTGSEVSFELENKLEGVVNPEWNSLPVPSSISPPTDHKSDSDSDHNAFSFLKTDPKLHFIPRSKTRFTASVPSNRYFTGGKLESEQISARRIKDRYAVHESLQSDSYSSRPNSSVVQMRRTVLEQQRAKFNTKKIPSMQIARNQNYRAPILPGVMPQNSTTVMDSSIDSYYLNASDIQLMQKTFASFASDQTDRFDEAAHMELKLSSTGFSPQEESDKDILEESKSARNTLETQYSPITPTLAPQSLNSSYISPHSKTQSLDFSSSKRSEPTRDLVLNVSFKPSVLQISNPIPDIQISNIDTTTPSISFKDSSIYLEASDFATRPIPSTAVPKNPTHTRVSSSSLPASHLNTPTSQSTPIPKSPEVKIVDILLSKMQNMKQFLMDPLPKGITLQCILHRMNTGFNKLYPKYFLTISKTQEFLLAAKKRSGNKTSNYLICYGKENLSVKSSKYFGKVRSNFSGHNFIIYDTGRNPKKRGTNINTARQELAVCLYVISTQNASKMTHKGPRNIQVLIPSVKSNDQRAVFKPLNVGLI